VVPEALMKSTKEPKQLLWPVNGNSVSSCLQSLQREDKNFLSVMLSMSALQVHLDSECIPTAI
jgi:hypothetical protein